MYKIQKEDKILIIGLGLIGGSYAQGLIDKGYHVEAIDQNYDSIHFAMEHHFILNGTVNCTKEYVSQFDIIIFALYPKIFLEWVKKYHTYLKKGSILSDVTGVKGAIIYDIQSLIKDDDCEFIGAHPMAGKEVYGVRHSSKTIFKNANYIVTPTSNNSEKAIEIAKDIGAILEFKNISVLTPEQHDEMIAFLSQLTHCIAVSLMTCKESKHLVEYTGDSFRDLTRIANINEDMWSELFLLNKKELISQMDLFLNEFEKLRNAIQYEDINKMKELMRLSTLRRSFFNKK